MELINPAAVSGLAIGRVVHFACFPEWTQTLGMRPGEPIGGRISQIMDPFSGKVTIHLDALPSEPKMDSRDEVVLRTGILAAVVSNVPYSAAGKSGTWMYPPRVA